FKRVDSNTLTPNQVLTKEVREDLKRWEELIRENVFSLGGHRDHLLACLSHILYCILAEQQYNLAYFFAKQIESAKATPKAYIPYDKLVDLEVTMALKRPVISSLLRPLATLDHHVIKKMMITMRELLELALHLLILILVLFRLLLIKPTKSLHPLNK
nr:ribosomal protein L7Ae/L30e/S12e/Gadd45 [Tanacetum cinerariifolium]